MINRKYIKHFESFSERSIPEILKKISIELKDDISKYSIIGYSNTFEFEYLSFNVDIKLSNNGSYYSNIDLLKIIKEPDISVDIVVYIPNNFDIDYIVATIVHEVRHIYDIYTINSENDMKSFVDDFYIRKLKIGNYTNFINLIYLSLEHELIARNNMIFPYIGSKNMNEKDSMDLVKSTFIYKSLDLLDSFDHISFVNSIEPNTLLKLTNIFIKDVSKDNKQCSDINDLILFYQKYEKYFKSLVSEWKLEINKEISKIYELKTYSNNESIISGTHRLFIEIYNNIIYT